MAKRVFISKNDNETGQLKLLLKENKIELISHSFLNFNAVEFDEGLTAEIIFFGSPRAVEFFTDKVSIPTNVKIASVGSKTSAALEKLGYTPDFSGDSSDSNIVAKEFKAWTGARTVLFPLSDISLKTVVNHFEAKQKREIIVYETIVKEDVIQPCDVYVFTSPSNLRGFLKLNVISENAVVIAWGTSTAKELNRRSIHVDQVLSFPSMTSLTEVLCKI